MKRSPLSLSISSAWARGAAGAIACAALAAGLLAVPGAAGASPRTAQVAPLVSCPSASAVSAAAGYTLPAPTTNTNTGTSTDKSFGKITGTSTECSYTAITSLQSYHLVVLLFSHINKTLPLNSVKGWITKQLNKANASLTTFGGGASMAFHYKFGTLSGVNVVWLSATGNVKGFSYSYQAVYGYKGQKIAGAGGVNVTQGSATALAKLAFSTYGV